MRRKNRMQSPVNIGGTGRERKTGRMRFGRRECGGTKCGNGSDVGNSGVGRPEGEGMEHICVGKAGEKAALEYLLQNGYKLLERNWHCRHKEVDLILEDGEGVHIVEVKTRTEPVHVEPERAVDYRKQRNLEVAAGVYLRLRGKQTDIHFDIVSVILDRKCNVRCISFIKDAFFPIKNGRQNITI